MCVNILSSVSVAPFLQDGRSKSALGVVFVVAFARGLWRLQNQRQEEEEEKGQSGR